MVPNPNERHGLLGHNDNEYRERDATAKRLVYVMSAIMGAVLIATIAKRASKSTPSDSPSMSHKHHHAPHETLVRFPFDLEGKSKGKDKHEHKHDHKHDEGTECDEGDYSDHTLKLAYELPFASLFQETKGQTKFEASDVVVEDGYAYAICDSSWAISKFSVDLKPFSSNNVQLGDPKREKDDSGYEALFFEDGQFYVIRESVEHNAGTYHAIIEELKVNDDDYEVVANCSSGIEFDGSSKGFEGAVAIHDANNSLTILALCEANLCSEKEKYNRGHGRITVLQKFTNDNTCVWLPVRVLEVPKSAYFLDYSSIAMTEKGRVAISSQEDSKLWVGQLKGRNKDGTWDISELKFEDKGDVYDFPKDHECETVYCNIEGVHWINDDTIMAVSDKMKGKGKQHFRCFEKDQSVHVFALP